MKKLYLHSFRTSLGQVRTAATERGLAIVALPGESERSFEGRIKKHFAACELCRGGKINEAAKRQIIGYLEGKLRRFSLKLDIHATAFQKRVLRQVAGIPYGRTMTYGEIARAIGNPKAFRAVGSANASNILPLVIPCHRVVASNGLGGYGGGLHLKKRLLRMEGAL